MTRRWELTDRQRLLLILAAASAIFLGAMALGGQSPWLLLLAVGIPSITAAGVLLLSVRRSAQRRDLVTADVLSVSVPLPGSIIGRCDIRLAVTVPGRSRTDVRVRAHDLPVTKWPQPGQTLPVEVVGGNPQRHLRIRWDLVDQGHVRAPDPTPPRGRPSPTPPRAAHASSPTPARSAAPVDAEIVQDATPPRQRRDPATRETSPTARLPIETFIEPDEPQLDRADDPTVRTRPHPSDDLTAPPPAVETPEPTLHPQPPTGSDSEPVRPSRSSLAARDLPDDDPEPVRPSRSSLAARDLPGNGHDPDGYDPGDFEPARLEPLAHPPAPGEDVDFEPMTLPDFDPAEIDRRDFGEEPPATPFDDEEEYGVGPRSTGGTTPPIPQPRPAEPSTDAGENRTEPAPESEPEPEPAGVAAVLPVDDLERSLRFYGETMGFTIAYATSTNAMVESGRTRILLRQGSAQRPTRTDQLQLQVADVEARYRDLQSRGVEFPEPPRALSSDDDLELWLARLRDPDGHEIELIEWRQRS